jgi:hypothetical protein
LPLQREQTVFVAETRLTLGDSLEVNTSDVDGLSVHKTPYEAPAQIVPAWLARGAGLPDDLPLGTGVFNARGDLVGLVLGQSGQDVLFSPVSAWLEGLFALQAETGDPTLAAILAEAVLPPAVDGADSFGDAYAPELGNGGYEVTHYDLNLTASPITRLLEGTATLDLRITTPNLVSLTLDLRLMTVRAVRVAGESVAFEQGERKVRVFLPRPFAYGETLQLAVDYGGRLDNIASPYFPFGLIGGAFDPEAPRLGFLTQPDTADTWFPNNNHPADDATFSFAITTPKPFTAIANGTPRPPRDNGDGTRTFFWQMDAPMTTYLANLVLAEYTLIEDVDAQGRPLRHYVYSSANVEQMRQIFSETPLAMQILEDLFGPYPFESYGHAVVPVLNAALEMQTMTVMPFSVQNVSSPESIWFLVVHELAHQWYGNEVRLGAWQDIWLNEGFASYAEWLADEFRYQDQRHVWLRAEAESALVSSGRPTPLAYPTPAEMFSNDSYVKGAWVLHMLRESVGDAAFFDLLKAYARAFADLPTTTAAFFQFAERHLERDLSQFRRQWLEQAGLPLYTLYWTPASDGASVLLCNERPDSAYVFDLPLRFSLGQGDSESQNITLAVGQGENRADFKLGWSPTRLEVDPLEAVLEGITPRRRETLPATCP